MDAGLAYLNDSRNPFCLGLRNDSFDSLAYRRRMAAPKHDWYVNDWLRYFGKKQADVVRDLEWNKAKISLTAAGKQPYDRDDINEMAEYLLLEPFELLLPPERAMSYRQLRSSAEQIVTLAHQQDEPTVTSFREERFKRGKLSPAKPGAKSGPTKKVSPR
jgi:hypothetical protein